MKLYKTKITPISNFITPIKGDTLFGQMCWAIRFAYGEDKLKKMLSDYDTAPFLIVSDAFTSGYFPKPTMPSKYLKENSENKKINRKKIWLTLDQLVNGSFNSAKTDKDIRNTHKSESVVKNAINYKTFTTGDGFDPFAMKESFISPQDIYFLIRDDFSLDELKKSLTLVANMGYGKKSTIGKGRFLFNDFEEINIKNRSRTFMTLSAFTPMGIDCEKLYYEPFTRFGKSGANRANTNAFKKPILLADVGAVVSYKKTKELNYIGKEITNISTYKDIVHQGYSIVIPIKEI